MRKPQRNERQKRPYRDKSAESVMTFVECYVGATGVFPTKARIARHLGWLNPHAVFPVLDRLATRGRLERVRIPRRGFKFKLPGMPDEPVGLRRSRYGQGTEVDQGAESAEPEPGRRPDNG